MSGYQLNTHAAYGFVCNRETVSLYAKSGSLQCTVLDAKRLMQDIAERAPSDGNYLRTAIDWRLPGDNVSGTVTPGCKILSFENLASIVLEVDPPGTYAGTWNCYCQALMVLGFTVQYQQASCNAAASDGSRTVTDTNIGSPIPAAIQPMTAALGDQYGTKNFGDNYIAYLLTDPSGSGPSIIQAGDLFTDQNGVVYEVQDTLNRNRLDDLPTFMITKKL